MVCPHRRQSTACLNATQVIRLRPPMTVTYVYSKARAAPSTCVSLHSPAWNRNAEWLTGPHNLVHRCQLERLSYQRLLSAARHRRKYFADVEIYVLVHRSEVSCLARIRIASVQQHERRSRVCLDERLQVGRARTRKRDIRVAKTGMELHCTVERGIKNRGNRVARASRTNDKEKKKKQTNPYQAYYALPPPRESCARQGHSMVYPPTAAVRSCLTGSVRKQHATPRLPRGNWRWWTRPVRCDNRRRT